MPTRNLPKAGDVIVSPKFAFGYYDMDRRFILVDGRTKRCPIGYYVGRTHVLRTEEFGAHDPSRATARFVVEEAGMTGGGTGHGPHDVYPDGWYIQARRLGKDGKFDSKGEVICFYMSGAFSCLIELKDVKVVGRMERKFV